MKMLLSLTIASALLSATPADAQNQRKNEISVTAKALTVDTWSRGVTRQLDRTLRYPVGFRQEPNEGVVRVNFRSSEAGKPTAVTLADSSGHRDLDRAAVEAVHAIRTLYPLASGIGPDQQYQAVLLFARDEHNSARQIAALRRDADEHNAQFAARGEHLAIGISLVPTP